MLWISFLKEYIHFNTKVYSNHMIRTFFKVKRGKNSQCSLWRAPCSKNDCFCTSLNLYRCLFKRCHWHIPFPQSLVWEILWNTCNYCICKWFKAILGSLTDQDRVQKLPIGTLAMTITIEDAIDNEIVVIFHFLKA